MVFYSLYTFTGDAVSRLVKIKKFIKEILKDSPVQESTDSIPLEEEQNSEFMGCPIEINDKIVTDFYVCEIL